MTRANTTPYRTERRFFFAALSLFFILFGLYIYFVSASVVQVIARKEVDREIAHMNSHVGALESTYITAKQAISENTIGQYGFVFAPVQKIYVQKAPVNLVFVTHDEN